MSTIIIAVLAAYAAWATRAAWRATAREQQTRVELTLAKRSQEREVRSQAYIAGEPVSSAVAIAVLRAQARKAGR